MELPKGLTYAVLFVFGLVLGSFLNVLIHRLSEERPWSEVLGGRSRCPSCGEKIAWYDNVPLLSFLILRGRCRRCGAPISLRYPLVELAGGLIPVLVYWKFHPFGWPTVLAYTLYGYLLLVLALVDWKTFTVPDELSVGGTLLGLVLSLLRRDLSFLESLSAAAAGFLLVVVLIYLYRKLRGVVPLGLGDAKVLALIGSFGGFWALYCALFAGSLLALLFFLPQILKSRSLQFAVPFVPFLAAGGFLGVFCRDLPIFV
ncbi:MAG: prepilin peptidase [Aquificae bacterium]|nr:prepilin peptidase [Aquificota bacterium]